VDGCQRGLQLDASYQPVEQLTMTPRDLHRFPARKVVGRVFVRLRKR
jgi:hypothetical protein